MGEYMRTLLNGLKAWVGGEINKLRAKIEAVGATASKEAGAALNVANAAQNTANAAQNTANAAQNTANAAQNTANAAQNTANAAQNTAEILLTELVLTDASFTFDKQITGRTKIIFNAFSYYKISNFAPHISAVKTFRGTTEAGQTQSSITVGTNCCEYGPFIAVFEAGLCKLLSGNVTFAFNAPSRGLYAKYEDGNTYMTAKTGAWSYYRSDLVVTSPNNKRFHITVSDDGTLSATEVTS